MILTHNSAMRRILIIGCGDIALRTAKLLRMRYRLFGLARSPARFDELRAAGITPVPGDLDDAGSLHRLAGLAHIVLHFAPPNAEKSSLHHLAHARGTPVGAPLLRSDPLAAKGGQGGFATDTRTRNLLAALSRGKPPGRLIYISTSGVYGDCAGALVAETHPLNAQTARARLRMDAERQICGWAKRNGVNAGILRVPGIYAADRLPLERLRAGIPAIVQQEDSYTNLIHADDLARIVAAALRHARPNRVYHASDDSGLKMGEYFDAVADAYGLPRPPRLPRAEVQRTASPMLWSFMSESRRLTNTRMKRELKIALRYPTVADALKISA